MEEYKIFIKGATFKDLGVKYGINGYDFTNEVYENLKKEIVSSVTKTASIFNEAIVKVYVSGLSGIPILAGLALLGAKAKGELPKNIEINVFAPYKSVNGKWNGELLQMREDLISQCDNFYYLKDNKNYIRNIEQRTSLENELEERAKKSCDLILGF